MAKYTEEFKIKLVTEYLDGNIGYGSLAKKNNMGSHTPIVAWVRAYKSQGIDGLKRRETQREYSVQFNLDTNAIYVKHRCFLFRYSCSLQFEQPILNRTLEKGIS